MAYLLVWTGPDGNKDWKQFADEADAYDAVIEYRRNGIDANVLSTDLDDTGEPGAPQTQVPGGFSI
jgi:hypothetical protein